MEERRKKRPGYMLIFRRYRTVKGKVLDAYDYGFEAWPMWIKLKKKK